MARTVPAITGEIFQVAGEGLSAAADAAAYLLRLEGTAALIDAGSGAAPGRLLANIGQHGVAPEDLRHLFLTHCHYDHTGGAAALKGRCPGLKIAAQALEAPYLEGADQEVSAATWYGARLTPVTIDLKWQGPVQTFELAGRVLTGYHTPGHSPGSAVYVIESEGQKVLFGQDVHGPLHPSLLSDREAYRRSLHLLLELAADILCEGHYGVIRGPEEVAAFIRRFL